MKTFNKLRAALEAMRVASIALTVAFALVGLVIGPAQFARADTRTITPLLTVPPRVLTEQAMHYIRFTFNYNQCQLTATNTACSIRVTSLPYNAFLVAISSQIITTFNPTTSATLALGTSGQSANIMAAMNVFTAASTAAVYNTTFAGAGELVTGAGATPTASNGSGFDVYVTYTVGAAGSQGTQGQVIFIIQYIGPNDGSCITIPAGSTAPAC